MLRFTPLVRISCHCLLLTLILVLTARPGLAPAQEGKVKAPELKHAMDLAVRKAGELKFTKDTRKVGVEAYIDPNTSKLIYIAETGALAVLPAGTYADVKDRAPEWKSAMELRVRKAGQASFDKDTPRYGIEVFLDPSTRAVIYISETGSIAAVPFRDEMTFKGGEPAWKHAMSLSARKAGQKDFTPETPRFGVEVFEDPNTGCLIYLAETGSIAVTPGSIPTAEKVQTPEWVHAAEVLVRKAGEEDFNDKTPKLGFEVFLDKNASKLVAISEKGYLALPGGSEIKASGKGKAPPWKHGLDLRVRKAGQSSFDDAIKLGVEVYQDEATSSLIYIDEVGALSLTPASGS